MKRVALVALAGLALVLAPRAWAGEVSDGFAATTAPLAQVLGGVDDDTADIGTIAADGPLLSYSLVLDFDNPETNILSPHANVATFSAVTNTITTVTSFSGITTMQQSAGNANGTSNLVLLIDGSGLDNLVDELFGPDDTLLETEGTTAITGTGRDDGAVPDNQATAGGKPIVGGVAHHLVSSSTLNDLIDILGTGGVFAEFSNPVTAILSPHANNTESLTADNLITDSNNFAGVSTLQQQAGGANGQSNLVAVIFSSSTVDTLIRSGRIN